MIEVTVWLARGNAVLQKNGAFLEGEMYFGRLSKDGNCYVMRSEEGYWIPVERYRWVKRGNVEDNFERKATIYMLNRKRLNRITNVEDYLNGDNCEKWWYGTQFRDKEFLRRF